MTDILSLPHSVGSIGDTHQEIIDTSGHSGFVADNLGELEMHMHEHGAPKLAVIDFSWVRTLQSPGLADHVRPLLKVPAILVCDDRIDELEGLNLIARVAYGDQYTVVLPRKVATFFDLQAQRPGVAVTRQMFEEAYVA